MGSRAACKMLLQLGLQETKLGTLDWWSVGGRVEECGTVPAWNIT